MRYHGKLKTWNDARGFGFIAPVQGEQDIFVHASELPRGARPGPDKLISYELAEGAEGRKKAVRVQLRQESGTSAAGRVSPHKAVGTWSPFGWLGSVVFLVVLAGIVWGVYRYQDNRVNEVALSQYKCDGRTHCSQMTSCAEAKFFLKYCPGTAMDGNNDGVPCETQWCQWPWSE
jgi:cold shock CspA family protein